MNYTGTREILYNRRGFAVFVGGETIVSQEGTTQGDPLAMAMYSLGVVLLILSMSEVP